MPRPWRAQGLMQRCRERPAILGVGNPFDAAQNIRGGGAVSRQPASTSWQRAPGLAAHNAGPANVDK